MNATSNFRLGTFPRAIKGMVYFRPPGYKQVVLMRITKDEHGIHWEVTPDLPVEDRDYEFGLSDVEPGKFREEFGPSISLHQCRFEKSFTIDGKTHTFKTSQDPKMVQAAITFYGDAVKRTKSP